MTKEDLLYVFQRLLVIYEPKTAISWLLGKNTHLGDRQPIEVLSEGDYQAVHRAIDADIAGSYA